MSNITVMDAVWDTYEMADDELGEHLAKLDHK
jgi:hypothetical protein